MNFDNEFMEEALTLAQRSLDSGLMPVGAVVVRNNVIVARGRKTGQRNKRLDHAELTALTDAMEFYDDGVEMTLFVTLEPCLMCFATAANLKISRIVYALEDPYGGIGTMIRWLREPHYKRPVPKMTGSVLRDDAIILFRRFFASTTDDFWRNPDNPLTKICLAHK